MSYETVRFIGICIQGAGAIAWAVCLLLAIKAQHDNDNNRPRFP